jgi:hypothetical protein
VDLKTSARRYTDLQVEASLQLSVYSYATAMNGLGEQEDLRLRFDVLTKTKQQALPVLDAAGPGGERATLPPGGGGAAGHRGGGVRAESGVAVQGLPVPGAVLGVEIIWTSSTPPLG